MTTLPEQFSEASKTQLEAQFNFFQTFTGKAFESAEKLIALNFDVSRASFEKSSALVRQLVSVKDPRDLFALTGQTQFQFDSALAYGRQLFGIAAGVAAPASVTATAPASAVALSAQPLAAPEPAMPAGEPAAQAVFADEPAAAPVADLIAAPAPIAELFAEPAPIADPTPIAKAAGAADALPKPSAASFPVQSSSKPIEVTQVKPVDAEPPPAPVAGTPAIVAKQAAAAPKPARKK